MKCCHFKMTGRGKRLPLLAVFKTRESGFIRNKQNLILKKSCGDETWFFSIKSKSLFIAWGNSGTLFFSVFPFLSFLSRSLFSGVRQWPQHHGRFDQQCCSKATNICPNSEAAFFSGHHMPPATCQKNKHAFAVKGCWKKRKMCICVERDSRCERRDLGGGERMQSWRNGVSQGTSQTSLGSLREAPVLNFNTTERDSEVGNLNGCFTCPCLPFFCSVFVRLAYVSTTEVLLLKKKGCCFHPHTLHSKLWLSFS